MMKGDSKADQVANLLALAVSIYNERNLLKIHTDLQDAAVQELDSYKVLSTRAIAAIVGCTPYRVEESIGKDGRRARGKLNPEHIPWLAYALSLHKITPDNLRMLLRGGTSLSTVEDLTLISRATLNRWRKQ